MNKFKEAVVLLAKCGEQHKTYGMRAEKISNDHWIITWAFPIKESAAHREGYDKTTVRGTIEFSSDYPGCPYCGGNSITLCSCGNVSCTILKNDMFTCEWCKTDSTICDYNGEISFIGTEY